MKVLDLPGNPWNNKYSCCLRNGFIINYLKGLTNDKTIAVPLSDGYRPTLNENVFQGFSTDIIIGVLCSLGKIPVNNKVVYMPLDDDIFQYGLKNVLLKDLTVIHPRLGKIKNLLYFGEGLWIIL